MLALDSSVSGVEDAASFSPVGCFVLLGFGKEAIFDQDMIRVRAHAQAKSFSPAHLHMRTWFEHRYL